MKIKQPLTKLTIAVVYLGTVGIYWAFDLPCIFKRFLHIPCPGCGMSHALQSLLRLKVDEALAYHPMVWSLPLLFMMFLTNGEIFKSKLANRILFSAIAVGFLINWVVILFR